MIDAQSEGTDFDMCIGLAFDGMIETFWNRILKLISYGDEACGMWIHSTVGV